MSGSLQGVRVMLTRPVDANDDMARLLEAAGATVTSVPLIRIVPPRDEAALTSAATSGDRFDWIVFTSANGVAAFACRRTSLLRARTRIAVVGPATGAAVTSLLHRRADLIPATFVAEALADAIAAVAPRGASVAIFQAQDARPALAARLRAAGFDVSVTVAYATVEDPPPDLVRRIREVDAVVLTSASGARSLIKGLGGTSGIAELHDKVVACIGPITARQAVRLGIEDAVTALQPRAEQVVKTLLGRIKRKQV